MQFHFAVLQMIMSLLMDKGDTILCESYTYPHMIESLVIPRGFRVQGIETDREGIIPEALSKALEQHTAQGGKPPRLLYTVPVGQNPTGAACAPAASTLLIFNLHTIRDFDAMFLRSGMAALHSVNAAVC